jgi:hypothetical protein
MSLAKDLDEAVKLGMNPDVTISIPVNLERVNKHVEITKNRLILIGGEPTAGKSTMVQTTFITDPIDWYLQNQPKGVRLSIISFLMERKQVEYTARWVSRKIYESVGEEITAKRILGRDTTKLTKGQYELVSSWYKLLDDWEKDDLLVCINGSKNPSGISMFIEAFAKRHGTIHKKNKEDKSYDNILAADTYEPNHPNHIVLVIGDNASVLDQEQGLDERGLVNKFNRTMVHARDVYGMSPVIVQHLNRDISSTQRQRLGDLVPKLSDFADTSQTQKAADIVIALLNPNVHITKESGHHYLGYDLHKMKDEEGLEYFRSMHIIKNNFGAANIGYPLGIHPQYGTLKILPRTAPDNPPPEYLYKEVTSGEWFKTPQASIEPPKKSLILNKAT